MYLGEISNYWFHAGTLYRNQSKKNSGESEVLIRRVVFLKQDQPIPEIRHLLFFLWQIPFPF